MKTGAFREAPVFVFFVGASLLGAGVSVFVGADFVRDVFRGGFRSHLGTL
jgi:hypothetical protein